MTRKSAGTYFVYMLRTPKNTLYTGITTDINRRFAEHRSGSAKAAKYTRAFKTAVIVYTERTATRSDALKREWQIKRMSRKEKDRLVRDAHNSARVA